MTVLPLMPELVLVIMEVEGMEVIVAEVMEVEGALVVQVAMVATVALASAVI